MLLHWNSWPKISMAILEVAFRSKILVSGLHPPCKLKSLRSQAETTLSFVKC